MNGGVGVAVKSDVLGLEFGIIGGELVVEYYPVYDFGERFCHGQAVARPKHHTPGDAYHHIVGSRGQTHLPWP